MKKLFLFLLIVLVFLPVVSSAESIDNWYLRYFSLCSSCQLNKVTFGNNTFVAVGNNGTILSSSDGQTYSELDFRESGTIEDLNGVVYGEGNFVAVGTHGTILVSPDGVNWEERTPYSDVINNLTAIAYGNGIFVAVGSSAPGCTDYPVLTSTDGLVWSVASNLTFNPSSITFGNGKFVAVGQSDIATSIDGMTWTPQVSEVCSNLTGVTFGNNMFVAVGDDGVVLTSADGITWELRNSGVSNDLRTVAFGNHTFVAVANPYPFAMPDFMITSFDGIEWTERFHGIDGIYYGLAFGNGTFIAAGAGGPYNGAETIQSDVIFNAPTSLVATATSSTSIKLTWQDTNDNETGFKVERKLGACSSPNSWAQIKTVGANVTTTSSTGLTADTTYSFRVRAYNAVANSAYSNCASAKTAAALTSSAPTNLKATSVSSNKVSLKWTAISTDATSFKVFRKAGGGSWGLLATLGANAVSHIDATASGNTSKTAYSYYVKACNSSGCSPATNAAVVPFMPVNLATSVISPSKIMVSWKDNSENVVLDVQRKSGSCSSANPWSPLSATQLDATSHVDTGLSSGQTYSYRVRARKVSAGQPSANGYSSYSACISEIPSQNVTYPVCTGETSLTY